MSGASGAGWRFEFGATFDVKILGHGQAFDWFGNGHK